MTDTEVQLAEKEVVNWKAKKKHYARQSAQLRVARKPNKGLAIPLPSNQLTVQRRDTDPYRPLRWRGSVALYCGSQRRLGLFWPSTSSW